MLAALLGFFAASSEAAPAARQVLLLQSFERGILVVDYMIVRSIIDTHGGTIVARNNPEGGATFTVTLRSSSATLAPGGLH